MNDQNEQNDQNEPTPPAGETPAEKPAPAPASPPAAAADEPAGPAPAPAPPRATAPPDGHWWWGTGRRKAAVARVRLRPGDGKIFVNKRDYEEYFPAERDRKDIVNVLTKTRALGSVDIHVNVSGGGNTGQAGAIVLGMGRALAKYDQTLDPILRENGFLTRDPRRVERKKYGQPGARRRFQFSKR